MKSIIKSKVLILSIAAAVAFASCGGNSNHSTELEPDVFLYSKSGMLYASGGGAIFPQAPNCICSYYEDSASIAFIETPSEKGICVQFYCFNSKPSDYFTIIFDNGKSVLVNQPAVKGDERYVIAIGESNPIYSDLYEGLMNSNECSISDAYPNHVFEFKIGGFEKLIKYLK